MKNPSKNTQGIRLSVNVVPRSSKNSLSRMGNDDIKLNINAPPVDGKANAFCIKFLSDLCGVAKSKIKILAGEKSKHKVIEILGDPDELYNKIIQALVD